MKNTSSSNIKSRNTITNNSISKSNMTVTIKMKDKEKEKDKDKSFSISNKNESSKNNINKSISILKTTDKSASNSKKTIKTIKINANQMEKEKNKLKVLSKEAKYKTENLQVEQRESIRKVKNNQQQSDNTSNSIVNVNVNNNITNNISNTYNSTVININHENYEKKENDNQDNDNKENKECSQFPSNLEAKDQEANKVEAVNSNNIKVVVRFRPLNEYEEELISDGTGSIICEYSSDNNKAVTIRSTSTTSNPNFQLDRVFNSQTTQKEIYENVAKEVLLDIINGYNGTIFTYGQSGSGKTFTMYGSDIYDDEEKGIIPRTIDDLFEKIKSSPEDISYQIKFSIIQIYKECVYDLITGEKDLKIKESPSKGIYVEGLSEFFIDNTDDFLNLLQLSQEQRIVSGTKLNSQSSRSHTIFMLELTSTNKIKNVTKKGILNLVDLAGTEKIKKTGAVGETLEEAKKINLSLSALGNVIHSLTSNESYIPYRDSKLTRILQESLGGNFKTTLLVSCSPHSFHIEETISTLKFAQRAKTIKNKVKMNIKLSYDQLLKIIKGYKDEIYKMTIWNLKLKEKVKGLVLSGGLNNCLLDVDEIFDLDEKESLGLERKIKEKDDNLNSGNDDKEKDKIEDLFERRNEEEDKLNTNTKRNRTSKAIQKILNVNEDIELSINQELEEKNELINSLESQIIQLKIEVKSLKTLLDSKEYQIKKENKDIFNEIKALYDKIVLNNSNKKFAYDSICELVNKKDFIYKKEFETDISLSFNSSLISYVNLFGEENLKMMKILEDLVDINYNIASRLEEYSYNESNYINKDNSLNNLIGNNIKNQNECLASILNTPFQENKLKTQSPDTNFRSQFKKDIRFNTIKMKYSQSLLGNNTNTNENISLSKQISSSNVKIEKYIDSRTLEINNNLRKVVSFNDDMLMDMNEVIDECDQFGKCDEDEEKIKNNEETNLNQIKASKENQSNNESQEDIVYYNTEYIKKNKKENYDVNLSQHKKSNPMSFLIKDNKSKSTKQLSLFSTFLLNKRRSSISNNNLFKLNLNNHSNNIFNLVSNEEIAVNLSKSQPLLLIFQFIKSIKDQFTGFKQIGIKSISETEKIKSLFVQMKSDLKRESLINKKNERMENEIESTVCFEIKGEEKGKSRINKNNPINIDMRKTNKTYVLDNNQSGKYFMNNNSNKNNKEYENILERIDEHQNSNLDVDIDIDSETEICIETEPDQETIKTKPKIKSNKILHFPKIKISKNKITSFSNQDEFNSSETSFITNYHNTTRTNNIKAKSTKEFMRIMRRYIKSGTASRRVDGIFIRFEKNLNKSSPTFEFLSGLNCSRKNIHGPSHFKVIINDGDYDDDVSS